MSCDFLQFLSTAPNSLLLLHSTSDSQGAGRKVFLVLEERVDRGDILLRRLSVASGREEKASGSEI